MKISSAVCIMEAFNNALEKFPEPESEKTKARDIFISMLGGSNTYIPKQTPIYKLQRNINIIDKLPIQGNYCDKKQVFDLARKYNISSSHVYRIRREAMKTYLEIEELYDYGLIEEQEHNQYIAILKEKLPQEQLGKSLQ